MGGALVLMLAINLCLANGTIDWINGNKKLDNKKNINKKNSDKVPMNPENRNIHDLEAGLHSLTSSELTMLSKFIDDQSKSGLISDHNPDGLLGVMENYWERHIRSGATKKRRTIDDVYDEIARENAGMPIRDEQRNNADCGKCHNCPCESILNNPNNRMKRENENRNIENGYTFDDYFKDLENSFPHESNRQHHVRIKRF